MTGPLPSVFTPVAVPGSWLYGAAITWRNRRFDLGRNVERIDRPVISVGNITTGGTGKTPVVRHIAELLRAGGHHPVIAMRGYGAVGDQPADEQLEYEHELPAVPVLAQPDRAAALRAYLPDHPHIDCVLLDDGFQHRRLHRDLDIVLIDATRRTFNDRLLPAGHLREPPANLARADAVIITRASSLDAELIERVQHYHGKPPLAWSRHVWTGLRLYHPHGRWGADDTVGSEDACETVDLDWLAGRRLLAMIGTGNPSTVVEQLEAAGAAVAATIPARDHDPFDRPTRLLARSMMDHIDAVAVTMKDWVKLRRCDDVRDWPAPIVVPHLAIECFDGGEALRRLVLDRVAGR